MDACLNTHAVFLFLTLCAFVLGCCIGSFMNVVVWRLPRGESLVYPPSHCPKCQHKIAPWENIPIISWLCLRARCSNCHLPISVKYPLGEAATGILYVLVWLKVYYAHLDFAIIPGFFFLTAALLAAALIDAEHWFIPDEVTISGTLFAFVCAMLLPQGRLLFAQGNLPQPGNILFSGFSILLGKCGLNLADCHSPALLSMVDCAFGAAFGASVLYCFAWSMKRLMGMRRLPLAKDTEMVLSAKGVEMNGKLLCWDELLEDGRDSAVIHGSLAKTDDDFMNVSGILANASGYSVDGKKTDWQGEKLKIKAKRFATPRDVIGLGDVKLLAMTGAFLGADATVYTMFGAAVLTVIFALLKRIALNEIQMAIPWGPFLALAAFASMMLL